MKRLFVLLIVGVLLGATCRVIPVQARNNLWQSQDNYWQAQINPWQTHNNTRQAQTNPWQIQNNTWQAQDSPWEEVAPGIEYQEFFLDGPNLAYVARMDRSNPSVILDSALAKGSITQERETVPAIADRANDAINFWSGEGGERNQVVVAINGSYIDRLTGLILSGQIQSGWYVKRFDDGGGESGFVWKYDRSAFIGGCVDQAAKKQFVSLYEADVTVRLDGVNIPREEDTLVLYTSHYSTTTRTPDNGLEVVVEMERPTTIMPEPQAARGIVREIRDGLGSTPIPFDAVVLSAHGLAREKLLTRLEVGDEIGITQEISSLDTDCRTLVDNSWSKAYASISGAFAYLRDGEIYHMEDLGAIARHPRTAIAYNDDYIFFIVVDGRLPGVSVGMSFDELAAFTRDELGATWGMAQDGGGSSTMLVNGIVKNHPVSVCTEDNNLYFPYVTNISLTSEPRTDAYYYFDGVRYGCLRPVGNAMMMIVNEPARRSQLFHTYDLVTARKWADLRLGPGTNYAPLSDLREGQVGMIIKHSGGLDGIFAKGSYWWKVSFGNQEGWVSEQSITKIARPSNNIPLEP